MLRCDHPNETSLEILSHRTICFSAFCKLKSEITLLLSFFQGFVVNVIQFRNSFDSQGPGVPGVRPAEAVTRLHDFQQRYTQFEAKRKTLDSVQLLFGIVPTPFPELDKTGEVRIT